MKYFSKQTDLHLYIIDLYLFNISMSTPLSDFLVSPDDYNLGRVLGEGGFGRVLEATEKRTGKQVAVKLRHEPWVNIEDQRYFFMRLKPLH
jgi:serine/threonine protein kinase